MVELEDDRAWLLSPAHCTGWHVFSLARARIPELLHFSITAGLQILQTPGLLIIGVSSSL
jgi:hypothetical protein